MFILVKKKNDFVTSLYLDILNVIFKDYVSLMIVKPTASSSIFDYKNIKKTRKSHIEISVTRKEVKVALKR
jgi:hypothetical protein